MREGPPDLEYHHVGWNGVGLIYLSRVLQNIFDISFLVTMKKPLLGVIAKIEQRDEAGFLKDSGDDLGAVNTFAFYF